MDTKDLIKHSIAKDAASFKKVFGDLIHSTITKKIDAMKPDVAKSMFTEASGGKEAYGVFSKGGSIGSKNDTPIKVFDDKAAAKKYAASMRKHLTPGEKKYYKMGYVVKVVTGMNEASGGKEAYQKFFKAKLKKYGVSSPSELSGDEEKKFYDEIDAEWEGKDEALTEGKAVTGMNEASGITASSMVKMYKNKDDWGSDMKDRVYVKKGNLVYIDSWYYNSDESMNNLVKSWKKGGFNYDYWADQGVNVKIVDTFTEVKATGRHKKYTKDGVSGVVLEVS